MTFLQPSESWGPMVDCHLRSGWTGEPRGSWTGPEATRDKQYTEINVQCTHRGENSKKESKENARN